MLVLRTAYLENNGYAISYCMKALGGMSQVFKNQIGINFTQWESYYLFTKVRESVRETFLQIIQKPWATNT